MGCVVDLMFAFVVGVGLHVDLLLGCDLVINGISWVVGVLGREAACSVTILSLAPHSCQNLFHLPHKQQNTSVGFLTFVLQWCVENTQCALSADA